MLFGINMTKSWLHQAAMVMNCKHNRLPFLYFGLPIGGDPRKLQFWYSLVDCIRSRLTGWKGKKNSLGTQLILLKSVQSSNPVYFIFFFKSSSGIISFLDSIFLDFFYFRVGGCEDIRKLSCVKWDTLCLHTENEGLGVQRIFWVKQYTIKSACNNLTATDIVVHEGFKHVLWLKQVPLKVNSFT